MKTIIVILLLMLSSVYSGLPGQSLNQDPFPANGDQMREYHSWSPNQINPILPSGRLLLVGPGGATPGDGGDGGSDSGSGGGVLATPVENDAWLIIVIMAIFYIGLIMKRKRNLKTHNRKSLKFVFSKRVTQYNQRIELDFTQNSYATKVGSQSNS